MKELTIRLTDERMLRYALTAGDTIVLESYDLAQLGAVKFGIQWAMEHMG